MLTKISLPLRRFATLLAATLLATSMLWQAQNLLAAPTTPQDEGTTIFTFSGQLPAGATLPLPVNRATTTASNYSLQVSGDGPVDFEATNGATLMSGQALNGETFWGTGDLQPGVNTLNLTNNGATPATVSLVVRTLATTSYTWAGVANDGGQNSELRLVFPQSGLYRFDFSTTGGAYKFDLDNGALQKQVVADTSAAYFVEAGTYPMTVERNAGASVQWAINIQPVADAPFDTLPYAKEGASVSTEVLPIALANAAEVNLVITPTGNINADKLNIQILDPDNNPIYNASAHVGETFWGTFDLEQGNNSIRLTADGANTDAVGYNLKIDELPTAGYNWQGNAYGMGNNSHIRVKFATDGLYKFDYNLNNGRFQFIVNDDFIQKTVENTNSDVTYFIPAGTHNLHIDQDSTTGTENWQVNITPEATGNNTLPYAQKGGDVGGTGNDYNEEWLPISLDAAAMVNLSIETTGNISDDLTVHVYSAGASSATYTLTQLLGTEKLWGNFPLEAGINRLQIMSTNGNANSMTYDLNIDTAPTNGTFSWAGNALDAGLNAAVLVEFPTTGIYRFAIQSDPGFANLILDNAMMRPSRTTPLGNLETTYDVEVTAGEHKLYVVQDNNFPETTWSASVEPVTAVPSFFTFDGELANGESLTSKYNVPSGSRDFNYELTVTSGDVDLLIKDGSNTTIANVTAYNGETMWGTGTLNGNNDITLTNNSGGNINVTLTLYDIPTAGYNWDGLADGNNMAEHSHIRVNFPSSGLYTFNATNDAGRYQFIVQAGNGGPEVIRKTVDTSLEATYFVPTGTHDLFIHQDQDGVGPGPGADWSLNISNVGQANDSLPYKKVGGTFGQNGVDEFNQEWLTINLTEATAVNLRLIATDGAPNVDSLMVEVVSPSGTGIMTTTVYAGETHWQTFDLPAGLHLFHIVANGTTNGLSYDLDLSNLPTAPYKWTGIANGPEAQFSQARVTFPTSGLYTFSFDNPPSERYQFLINENFVQKTVEMSDTLTVFIPAGTHTLQAVPDSTGVVEWGVDISAVGAPNDSLPYTKMGGNLGNGDFVEEWLPINIGENTAVNLEMSVTGAMSDSLQFMIVNGLTGATETTRLERIYGTETLWATFDLSPADRIHIMADNGNTGRLSYQLKITPLKDATYVWQGQSLAAGLNSEVRMDLDADGVYRVELQVLSGLAIFNVDPTSRSPLAPTTGYTTAVTTSLTSGVHYFVVEQQSAAPSTKWIMTVSLLSAEPPTATGISPNEKPVFITQTANITGTDFQTGVIVELVDGTNRYTLSTQTSSGTLIVVTVPNTIPIGEYDVVITNPDSQTVTLTDAYRVTEYKTYLPLILRP